MYKSIVYLVWHKRKIWQTREPELRIVIQARFRPQMRKKGYIKNLFSVFDYMKIEKLAFKHFFGNLECDVVVSILIPFRKIHLVLHSLEQEKSLEGSLQS